MKYFIALVLAVLITGGIVGGYFYPHLATTFGASPSGSSFSDAKVAAINFTPATSAASTTALLNSDGNDRIIQDGFFACSGTNGIGVTITAATTSSVSATGGLAGNANYIINAFATTSAKSSIEYVSTSTEGVIQFTSRVWPANTALTFLSSTSASSSAYPTNCLVGVHYLGT